MNCRFWTTPSFLRSKKSWHWLAVNERFNCILQWEVICTNRRLLESLSREGDLERLLLLWIEPRSRSLSRDLDLERLRLCLRLCLCRLGDLVLLRERPILLLTEPATLKQEREKLKWSSQRLVNRSLQSNEATSYYDVTLGRAFFYRNGHFY